MGAGGYKLTVHHSALHFDGELTEGLAQLLTGREGFTATDADGDWNDGSALGVVQCVKIKRDKVWQHMGLCSP